MREEHTKTNFIKISLNLKRAIKIPIQNVVKRPAHQKVKPTVPQRIQSAQYFAKKVPFHQCAFITNLGLTDAKKQRES